MFQFVENIKGAFDGFSDGAGWMGVAGLCAGAVAAAVMFGPAAIGPIIGGAALGAAAGAATGAVGGFVFGALRGTDTSVPEIIDTLIPKTPTATEPEKGQGVDTNLTPSPTPSLEKTDTPQKTLSK